MPHYNESLDLQFCSYQYAYDLLLHFKDKLVYRDFIQKLVYKLVYKNNQLY